jgi:hypothetical protein
MENKRKTDDAKQYRENEEEMEDSEKEEEGLKTVKNPK